MIGQDEKRSLIDLSSIMKSLGGNQTDCYDYLTPNTTAEVIDQTIPRYDPSFTTFEDNTIYAFQYMNHYLAWNKSKLLKIENARIESSITVLFTQPSIDWSSSFPCIFHAIPSFKFKLSMDFLFCSYSMLTSHIPFV